MIITVEIGSKHPEKQDVAPLCIFTLNRGTWEIQGTPKMTTQIMWFLSQIQSLRNEYKRRTQKDSQLKKIEESTGDD